MFGHVIGFSATPGRIERPPIVVGQHTRQIMAELGYATSAIDGLIAEGVIAEASSTKGSAVKAADGRSPVTRPDSLDSDRSRHREWNTRSSWSGGHMTVIDVDTHWESTEFAPGRHPLEP